MSDKDKPAPGVDDEAGDTDFKRRDEALSEDLDDLEKQVKPNKPKAPPIGAMF